MSDFKDHYPEEKNIKRLSLSDTPKLIVLSDVHRGDGAGSDDFAHNSLIYGHALGWYFKEGFTYIELGDAEELWEQKSFDQIYIAHTSIYEKLRPFHDQGRYIKVWGNHDLKWEEDPAPLEKLFAHIRVYEAVLLNDTILLWHGHQADPKCRDHGGRFSKFFVRRFWPYMQKCGFKDPTRAASNPGRCNAVDRTLQRWAKQSYKGIEKIVAGHTHRPVFENLSLTERMYLQSNISTPGVRMKLKPDPTYYNTGSCVHPRCITGIEITEENNEPKFTLIKWSYVVDPAIGVLRIDRTVLQQ